MSATSETIDWLAKAIERLPSDAPVPRGTPGYNHYTTQRDHWLGWLNPQAGTGSYPRAEREGRDARDVYNRIVEPKMLIWLAMAAGVDPDLVNAAKQAANEVPKLATKSAAIRKRIPWSCVAQKLAIVHATAQAPAGAHSAPQTAQGA